MAMCICVYSFELFYTQIYLIFDSSQMIPTFYASECVWCYAMSHELDQSNIFVCMGMYIYRRCFIYRMSQIGSNVEKITINALSK